MQTAAAPSLARDFVTVHGQLGKVPFRHKVLLESLEASIADPEALASARLAFAEVHTQLREALECLEAFAETSESLIADVATAEVHTQLREALECLEAFPETSEAFIADGLATAEVHTQLRNALERLEAFPEASEAFIADGRAA